MLYFQNAAAHLTLHSAGSYIQVDWQAGAQPEVLVQQAMNHVLEGLLQQGWQKVLNQQRHKAAFSIELQAWITLDWRPRALQAGYRYGAFVQAQDVLAQLATLSLLQGHSAPWPRYHFCASETAAQHWLDQQPRVP